MLGQGWFHKQVTWPVFQNIIAGSLGAGLLLLSQGTVSIAGGCTTPVIEKVTRGETALAAGNLPKARAIVSDAIAEAPNCECANTLAAAISQARMKDALAHGDAQGAELERAQCFQYALKARPFLGVKPRIKSLLTSCKAET